MSRFNLRCSNVVHRFWNRHVYAVFFVHVFPVLWLFAVSVVGVVVVVSVVAVVVIAVAFVVIMKLHREKAQYCRWMKKEYAINALLTMASWTHIHIWMGMGIANKSNLSKMPRISFVSLFDASKIEWEGQKKWKGIGVHRIYIFYMYNRWRRRTSKQANRRFFAHHKLSISSVWVGMLRRLCELDCLFIISRITLRKAVSSKESVTKSITIKCSDVATLYSMHTLESCDSSDAQNKREY